MNLDEKICCDICFREFREQRHMMIHRKNHDPESRNKRSLASKLVHLREGVDLQRYATLHATNKLEETKLRRSTASKKFQEDPLFKLKIHELNKDPLVKKRRSDALRKYFASPAARMKTSIATKLAMQTLEVKQKLISIQNRSDVRLRKSIAQSQTIIDGRVRSNRGRASYIVTQKGGKIWCRSLLEKQVYQKLDLDQNIETFVAEPLRIEYLWNDKIRHYVPDILIIYSDKKRCLVEIKPFAFINFPVNIAKQQAASEFCNQNNMSFLLITERDL